MIRVRIKVMVLVMVLVLVMVIVIVMVMTMKVVLIDYGNDHVTYHIKINSFDSQNSCTNW